jgi:hypothetical protein
MVSPFRLLAAAAAAASLFAAAPPAAAAGPLPEGATVATLATPRAEPIITMIDYRSWSCTGAECRAAPSGAEPSQSVTRECGRAAQVLGAFTAYQTGPKVLTAAQLATCNATANK